MAADTVANLLINGLNPSVISTTATTISYFPYVPGSSIGVISGGGAITPSAKGFVAGFLPVPGSGRANGQFLRLTAVGNFNFGGGESSPTVTLTVGALKGVNIQSATLANITAIVAASITGSGETSSNSPFRLTVDMNADSLSGILQGAYTLQQENAAVVGPTAITALAGVNMSLDQPLAFCLGVTFSIGGGTTPNTANLYQFDLRQ